MAGRGVAALSLALAAAAFPVQSAVGYEGPHHLDSDQFGIEAFATSTSTVAAGASTDFISVLEMRSELRDAAPPHEVFVRLPFGRTKAIAVDLPPGLVVDPTTVPTCSPEAFGRILESESCDPRTQVGAATIEAVGIGRLTGPIFNLDPGPDRPALFGIRVDPTLSLFAEVQVGADGDLSAIVDEAPLGSPIIYSELTLWGVPADHGVPGPRVPFVNNPPRCDAPFVTGVRAESYEFKHDSAVFTGPPRADCAGLRFEPTISVEPTARVAGEPTGIELDLSLPRHEGPSDRATAHLKEVTVTLPEGVVLSASSVDGLGSCAAPEFGYGRDTPIACPLDSKVGTVTVRAPILGQPLSGPIYLARQDDNPFDSLVALYLAPAGSGTQLKLAGRLELDRETGRVTVVLADGPELPLSDLAIDLKTGPRALLALPRDCGTYTVRADVRSWARPAEPVPLSSSFAVDQGCDRDRRFTPGFSAGAVDPAAGHSSQFTLRITRDDDSQPNVARLRATLPEGVSAKLAGVPLCADDAAAAARCPEASRVGRLTVGAGAGPTPFFLPEPGRLPTAVYLGGPHQGAPYSLVAEVPALAGPFDLGTVVLRSTLRVDPRTARVTVSSEPLPQILRGVPIGYRDIRVRLDRPGFVLNPTSCEPKAVTGTIDSIAGQAAAVTDGFQARGCDRLPFKPRLAVRFSGPTHRSAHPKLGAVFTMPPGGANVERAQLILPRTQLLDSTHIRAICSRAQYEADRCPKASVQGSARIWTPLLDRPLQGPVHLLASKHRLPDLVASLRGQLEIDLPGRVDTVGGRIRATFHSIPDVPISRIALAMHGGRRGLLANNTDLCRERPRARARFEAQNGTVRGLAAPVRLRCPKPR